MSLFRVPGREMDTLEFRKTENSRHVAILRNGHFYAMPLYDEKRRPLPLRDLYQNVVWLMEDADKAGPPTRPGEEAIAALTAGSRTPWAEMRETEFATGINRDSLDLIESAAFFVSLDTVNSESLNEKAAGLIHGSGANRWFDKSFTLVIYPDGSSGYNVEHSFADATVCGYLVEMCMIGEYGKLQKTGHILTPEEKAPGPRRAALPLPTRLLWDLRLPAVEAIRKSLAEAQGLIVDLDLNLLVFEHFGKGFSKTCGIGPDGFIQAALQLAYYRDAGHHCQTYESASTRLFRNGRTETIRSCSSSMCDFVAGMLDDEVDKKRRVELLRKATDDHVAYAKMASVGQVHPRSSIIHITHT